MDLKLDLEPDFRKFFFVKDDARKIVERNRCTGSLGTASGALGATRSAVLSYR